jgi:hypothetical protein
MKLKKCRNCHNFNLKYLFSLGKLSYTGKFSNGPKKNIEKTEVTLVICKNCSLVQLGHNYNLKFLYNQDYGYRTGINSTMVTHMRKIHKTLCGLVKIKSGDYVLDIASNDGTLLNLYNKKIVKTGIDPLIKKYKNFYKNIEYKIPGFFSSYLIKKYKIIRKFKIITALSVFYDIEDPNKFLQDVNSILDDNGVFLLEHADLFSIVKNKMFDTICHEHITYYSTKVILKILNKNNLRVFNIKRNSINGGSIQYFICKKNSKFKNKIKIIKQTLKKENRLKLDTFETYKEFIQSVNIIKKKLLIFLNSLKLSKKIIHGYGASTKGNVLLQFFGISRKHINVIADRNPNKYNLFTPGTKIQIISEKLSRLKKPDYYLVLPWHFKKEILNREKKIIKEGTKFIFPLPKIKIY